ncbi:MAG TPA: DUF1844 domain-containing protein, partial [Candidatus Sulfotelmatobacter sp.]|nr:DUF1844 domain-containing protein [Candidatus Sulfotelmatobacter sp.]
LAHLGVPGPAGGAVKIDLAQAQQAIDLLEMLQQKTAGNLTAEEGGLLEGLLFDIRLRYVEAGKTGPAGGPACPTEKK